MRFKKILYTFCLTDLFKGNAEERKNKEKMFSIYGAMLHVHTLGHFIVKILLKIKGFSFALQ